MLMVQKPVFRIFCFPSCRYFKCIPLPGPLLIVILFTALSAGLGLESSAGIKVIGVIPSGFPSPRAPTFSTSFAMISELLCYSNRSSDCSSGIGMRLAFVLFLSALFSRELNRLFLQLCAISG